MQAGVDDGTEMVCPTCGRAVEPTDDQCPGCGAQFVPEEAGLRTWSLSVLPEMRYQNSYVWLILVSALDIMLTLLTVVIWQGGYEVNPIAAAVIQTKGWGWAIVFKFASIVLVIVLCEVIGRKSDHVGRRLSKVAVALNGAIVLYSLILLFRTPISE